jgi:hypothetical protein
MAAILSLSIALFAGGGALASHLMVQRSDIVRNAVNGAKVARNTLTGKDVKERTLAKVPRSARVDRSAILKLGRDTETVPKETWKKIGPLRITYQCSPDESGYTVVVLATTSIDNAHIVVGRVSGGEGYGNSDVMKDTNFDTGEEFLLAISDFGTYTFTYSWSAGHVVAGRLDVDTTGPSCIVHGRAVGG